VIKYSEMARKRNCTLEEIIEINSSEDGVIHYSGDRDKYLIAYNDVIEHQERVYWTLAHEFGHYLLGHHKESDRTSLARNEMTEEEYDAREVEANFFARFFLSPPPVIAMANLNDYQKIMDFFGVSYTAAKNTLNYIERSYKKGFRFFLPNDLFNNLKVFFNKVSYGKTCLKCGVFSYLKDSKFCPNCGSHEFHNFFKGADFNMYYPGIITNKENGKALECPVCRNQETEIEGEYCCQCGTHIVNRCTNLAKDWNGDFYHTCITPLPGNCRHCPQCGQPTTFLQNGLLKQWTVEREIEKQHQQNQLFLASSH
ncbi:ImmA/IrrE family metallo-endopeptidase, partial [Heyndrickxia sporothermodurans]|uniref:ImmA/IrrE family metallo-endopeptidase n=1 Tax=Heyndrickxia sporothermodurans TaxID=46224 RepID=UPI003695D3FA